MRLYPPEDAPWTHWSSFYRYCLKEMGVQINLGSANPNLVFKSFKPYLEKYNGKIIWPHDDSLSWSIECLEFKTAEDLLIFKLTFN